MLTGEDPDRANGRTTVRDRTCSGTRAGAEPRSHASAGTEARPDTGSDARPESCTGPNARTGADTARPDTAHAAGSDTATRTPTASASSATARGNGARLSE